MPPSSEASWAPDLIVYGGAFDPPHVAHAALLITALRHFPAAKAEMIPTAATPLAGNAGDVKIADASFAQRFHMCELVIAGLAPELSARASASRLEAELPQPSYTVATLTEIHRRAPKLRLALLVGGDQLAVFSRWREPRRILELASLLVVQRAGTASAGAIDAALSALGLAASQDGRPLIYALDGQPPAAASSELRAALAGGKPAPAGWLADDIAHYIESEGLYR